jgi:hypothetical protein
MGGFEAGETLVSRGLRQLDRVGEVATYLIRPVGVGTERDGDSGGAQPAQDVGGGVDFTNRPMEPGRVDLDQHAGAGDALDQAVQLTGQGPRRPVSELLDEVEMAQDGEKA